MIIRKLTGLPLALALIGAAAPPSMPARATPVERVRAHVEFLASDLLEGRETGTRGHEIAAAYVASQFKALGLTPGGENGGWYQQVPFRRATLKNVPTITTRSAGRQSAWRRASTWPSDPAC